MDWRNIIRQQSLFETCGHKFKVTLVSSHTPCLDPGVEKAESWVLQGPCGRGARMLRMFADKGRANEVNAVRGGCAPILYHPAAYSPPFSAVKGKALQTSS